MSILESWAKLDSVLAYIRHLVRLRPLAARGCEVSLRLILGIVVLTAESVLRLHPKLLC